MVALLKQRPVQTLLVLGGFMLSASFLPPIVHQGFYTLSLLLKDLLIWMMPLTVGCFVASTVASFEKKAPLFIVVLLVFEACSNLSSVWYAYLCAHVAASVLPLFTATPFHADFEPLWRLPWKGPAWWSADKGAFAGLLLGCMAAYAGKRLSGLQATLDRGKAIAEWVLTRVFARVIPLFILGFAAQIYQSGLLGHLLAHYSLLVVWLLVVLALYLLLIVALGAGGDVIRTKKHLRCLLPAGGMALTTGCSLSTMPWTIKGVEKVLKNPNLGKAIIPATTNIQQIGDCITNAFLCALIYRSVHGHLPEVGMWLHFSVVFVLARYATAAVLGGALFIMLPIYEAYLGFTPAMLAMIMAFNVVLDSLVTASNVIANGGLCVLFERVWTRLAASPLPANKPEFALQQKPDQGPGI